MTRRFDGLVDVTLALFASWTIAYQVALITRIDRDLTWIIAAVVAVVIALVLRRLWSPDAHPRDERPGTEVLLIAGLAVAFGLVTVIVRSPGGDDAYFLNRALYVSTHPGAFPIRDTIFADQVFPTIVPPDVVASYESLVGAVAAHVPIDVRTLYYLVFPTVFAMLGVLAMWRIARSAKASLPLVVAIGAVFFAGLNSANNGWSMAVFRPFWGKGILVWLIVPTLWHHATDFARTASRRSWVLAAVTGVAAVGFTSSGTFIAVVVIAACVVAALVHAGFPRAVALAATAAYPLAVGVIGSVALASIVGESIVGPSGCTGSLGRVFGPGTELWVSALMVVAAWAVLRAREVRTGVAVASAAALALITGIGVSILDVAGAGVISWRLLWAVPVPFLFGAVVDAPLHAKRIRGTITACVLAAVLLLAIAPGRLLGGLADVSRPSWDLEPSAVAAAQRLIRLADGAGIVAAPNRVSVVISGLSTEVRAANPRQIYVDALSESHGRAFRGRERALIARGVMGDDVDEEAFVRALSVLEVEAICVARRARDVSAALEGAGYEPRARPDAICRYWRLP